MKSFAPSAIVAVDVLVLVPLALTACGSTSTEKESAGAHALPTATAAPLTLAPDAAVSTDATVVTGSTVVPYSETSTMDSDDARAIAQLVRDWHDQPSVKSMAAFQRDNLCTRTIDELGGVENLDPDLVPDQSMDDLRGWSSIDPTVRDLRVDGSTGSAVISFDSDQGLSLVTWTFVKENDRWKICL